MSRSLTETSTPIDRIGFIGIGAIAEAVIRGLLNHGGYAGSIVVSRRSESRSNALADAFSSIQVRPDNQEIVDQCDWVFLSVLPQQTPDVLAKLNFRETQSIVSLVAGYSIQQISQMAKPVGNVVRLVPLPPIEKGLGPLPVCPPNSSLSQLFRSCGQVVDVEDESQLTTLFSVSGLMSMHHEMVAKVVEWMIDQGLDSATSTAYASQVFHGLTAIESTSSPQELQELPDESTTAGGLNEQVLRELRDLDWFETLKGRLDRLARRLG